MFTPGMPLWERTVCFRLFCRKESGGGKNSGPYELCGRTLEETLVGEKERETDGAVASPCGAESWEYWPASGATAVLPICTRVRRVVEEIHQFGGFY